MRTWWLASGAIVKHVRFVNEVFGIAAWLEGL